MPVELELFAREYVPRLPLLWQPVRATSAAMMIAYLVILSFGLAFWLVCRSPADRAHRNGSAIVAVRSPLTLPDPGSRFNR
jgi:hypothetical protein